MSSLHKLLNMSSPALSEDVPSLSDVGDATLHSLLTEKNGFFCFEYSLEVFPCGSSALSYPLQQWNDRNLWRGSYGELAPSGTCFAQDAFGGQFVLFGSVYTFDPETGEVDAFASNLEEWAANVIADYEVVTGFPIAHEWQSAHGRIAPRSRLTPVTPFVFGGEFNIANLVQMDAVKSLRLRGSLAQQIKNAPDGSRIIYEVTE